MNITIFGLASYFADSLLKFLKDYGIPAYKEPYDDVDELSNIKIFRAWKLSMNFSGTEYQQCIQLIVGNAMYVLNVADFIDLKIS